MMNKRRRALMMMQATPAPEPGGTPITGLVWTTNTQITSTGAISHVYYAAATIDAITPVPAGVTKVRFTGTVSYDSATINVFVHEYEGTTWKRRLANMNSGVEISLTATTAGVRFTFAFPSGSGKDMTQAVIDACFAAEWV